MIKSIKKAIKTRQDAKHLAWAKKNLPMLTREISDNMVFQLWGAGIRFEHINRWLRWRNMKTIVAYYVIVPGQRVKYFTAYPDAAQKEEARVLGKQIYYVN